MKRDLIGAVLGVALLSIILPPSAQATPNEKEYAGKWQLALHGRHCAIRLLIKRDHGAFSLVQKCPDFFPMQSVVAWRPYDGEIVYLSETGAPIVTFEATEEIYLATNNPELSLRRPNH